MERGDYLSYKIDWDKKEMHLVGIGPMLQGLRDESQGNGPIAVTPIAYALEYLAGMTRQAQKPYRFLLDVRYDGDSLITSIHRTEDYASVVDVPRSRLKKALGTLLTPREFEVAALLFEGCTIRYIASALHITEGTVKRIIYNIYQKLNVGSQVELVREIYVRLAQHCSFPCACADCQYAPEERPACCLRRNAT